LLIRRFVVGEAKGELTGPPMAQEIPCIGLGIMRLACRLKHTFNPL